MKKRIVGGALSCILCVYLAGCTASVPLKAADGADWSDTWTTIGILGVEEREGWVLQRNEDVLSPNGMYYATWSTGTGKPYTNEEGEEVDLYDAQIYLLLAGYDAIEKAEENRAEWQGMAEERYVVTETSAGTYNGQKFTLLTYTYQSNTNPYSRGISALGTYGNYAINVELSCQDSFKGDERAILEDFLQHCHYSA